MSGKTAAHQKGAQGFTLVELAVVLALGAVAALIISLSFPSDPGKGNGRAAAREIFLSLRLAHWKALMSGSRTRWTAFSPQGGTSSWYVIEREVGARWVPEGPARRLPEGVELRTTGPDRKIFYPNGTCSLGGILLDAPGAAYRLALNPLTGRVRLYRNGKEADYEK